MSICARVRKTRGVPVTLRCGDLETTWLPEHGMVGASLRHRGGELLGQRGGLDAYLAKGSAFGIPLLAPWANRLDGLRYGDVALDAATVKGGDVGLPKDGGGVLVGREWTVRERSEQRLRAAVTADQALLAVFPFPHELEVTVELRGTGLEVITVLTATGDVPVPVAFGWHPLFTLPGVPRGALQVRLPLSRELVLDDRGIPTGDRQTVVIAPGPLDGRDLDAEYDGWDGDVVLRGGGRELLVRFAPADGYPIGHLWAPRGEDFLAWEPMTAPTNALVSGVGLQHVAPGERYTATFSVAVRSIS